MIDPVSLNSVRALFDGTTSGYDTHRPMLCEAVLRTSGPILELGMGEGSTPALHSVATTCNRPVFSFEHDSEWVAKFLKFRTTQHYIAQVMSWDDCPIESFFWSLAFVDHAPAERRIVEIDRLAFRAELVVVHDTEDAAYGYERVFGNFMHRYDYRKYHQWTSVLSNYLDVSEWEHPSELKAQDR